MTGINFIEGLQKGDKKVFEQFVKTYQDNVVRTCYGLIHNLHDAKDVAQEVFIEVFRSVSKFRGDASVTTWLYRIAVNKSLNYIRDNKKRKSAKPLDDVFKNAGAYEPAVDEQSKKIINEEDELKKEIIFKAIDSLPEKQRAAFVLSKYEEMSNKEVAETLRLSISAVESLVHRAKLQLQKKLIHLNKF